MRPRDSSSNPNPFAGEFNRPKRSYDAVFRAAKMLVAASCVFAVILIVMTHNNRWMVSRLTTDFDTLTPASKIQRLVQISELGPASIPHLVSTLADDDLAVARTANNFLHDAQQNWTMLPKEQLRQHHQTLVTAMADRIPDLQNDRTGWVASLLQQTMLESASGSDDAWLTLNRSAAETLASFSLAQRAADQKAASIATSIYARPDQSDDPADSILPIDQVEGNWVKDNYPDPGTRPLNTNTAEGNPQSSLGATDSNQDTGASIYRRASSELQPVAPGETVVLRTPPSQTTNVAVRSLPVLPAIVTPDQTSERVQPAGYLSQSPFETLDITSVITWLGENDIEMRRLAEQELRKRGMSEREITLSKSLASADVQTRIGLVDILARSQDIDPRFWLGMLLSDPNREVKLAAISVLATMDDPKVRQLLQLRMAEDSDPIVVAKLRRSLGLR